MTLVNWWRLLKAEVTMQTLLSGFFGLSYGQTEVTPGLRSSFCRSCAAVAGDAFFHGCRGRLALPLIPVFDSLASVRHTRSVTIFLLCL